MSEVEHFNATVGDNGYESRLNRVLRQLLSVCSSGGGALLNRVPALAAMPRTGACA